MGGEVYWRKLVFNHGYQRGQVVVGQEAGQFEDGQCEGGTKQYKEHCMVEQGGLQKKPFKQRLVPIKRNAKGSRIKQLWTVRRMHHHFYWSLDGTNWRLSENEPQFTIN